VPDYARSVFINCPFDQAFEPVLHAIVLAIVARGFEPRCARESEGQASPRIVRIATGLAESKYSIHDLSRYQGEGADNIARFNMPLELGMALGIRHLRAAEHNWVALVPENFVHQKFISDLAGYDPYDHDQTPARVIKRVADWLSLQPDFNPPSLPAREILAAYEPYRKLLDKAAQDALGSPTWPVIVASARIALEPKPPAPGA